MSEKQNLNKESFDSLKAIVNQSICALFEAFLTKERSLEKEEQNAANQLIEETTIHLLQTFAQKTFQEWLDALEGQNLLRYWLFNEHNFPSEIFPKNETLGIEKFKVILTKLYETLEVKISDITRMEKELTKKYQEISKIKKEIDQIKLEHLSEEIAREFNLSDKLREQVITKTDEIAKAKANSPKTQSHPNK